MGQTNSDYANISLNKFKEIEKQLLWLIRKRSNNPENEIESFKVDEKSIKECISLLNHRKHRAYMLSHAWFFIMMITMLVNITYFDTESMIPVLIQYIILFAQLSFFIKAYRLDNLSKVKIGNLLLKWFSVEELNEVGLIAGENDD